jgi:hypothetical protein
MSAPRDLHGGQRSTGGSGRVVGDVLMVGRVAVKGLGDVQPLQMPWRVGEEQILEGRTLGTAPLDAMHGTPKVGRRGDDALRPLRVAGCRIASALGMVKDDHTRETTAPRRT